MASGIFSACGNIRPMTLEKLNRHTKFAFPDRYFNGIDTAGRLRAVSVYYLYGKSPTHIVFAKAVVLGKEVRLAIACSSEKTRKVIIKDIGGRQNLVTVLAATEIESVSPIRRIFRSAFPKPNPIVPPDFSFQSAFPAEKKRGTISRTDKAYLKYLANEMKLTWELNKFNLPGSSAEEIIESAAEALVRSSDAKLERLIAWRMLLPEDADNIFTRSRQIDAERIALMLMGLTAEHIALGNFSPQQIKTAAKELVPHHFINYLSDAHIKSGVSLADAWYFAKEYSDPETALKTALTEAERLAKAFKKDGVSPADAWHFAVKYSDPETTLKNTLAEAERVAKAFKKDGVSPADAWYFAVRYSKPKKALKVALAETKRLAGAYKKDGVSPADAWYFAVHHSYKPEKALKAALAEAKRLANKHGVSLSAVWYFAAHHPSGPEKALETAQAETERLAKEYSVSPAVAWHFATHYSDHEEALKTALAEAKRLANKHGVSPAAARRCVVRNPSDPEAAIRNRLGLAV